MKLTKVAVRRHRRGFTLTELMVSLVMGLIVALAAVGLARTATTTFHEQARSSGTEMALRVASDRLRQDLMRTSYMSTGNIALDPKVAQTLDAKGNPAAIARYAELTTLRGISVDQKMANSSGIPSPLAGNGIEPDALELVGNFATDDAYTGTLRPGGSGGVCANAQTIEIPSDGDAATYMLGGGVAGAVDAARLLANAQAAFQPKADKTFLAQVTDGYGCNFYVPVCNVTTTGASPNPKLLIMVDGPSGSNAILPPNGGGSAPGKALNNCGADENTQVTIAPLQHVRWRLKLTATAVDASVEGAAYDLVRETFSFSGDIIATEVVAEFVIDMKFSITVDDETQAGAGRQIFYDGDDDPTGNISKITAGPNSVIAGNLGPQHVRSVRFRLSIRAPVPDRDQPLAADAGKVVVRYCVDPPTCSQYARVRTVTSEVALTNQARMLYR